MLWGGGVYDWLDPVTAIRAIDRVRQQPAQRAALLPRSEAPESICAGVETLTGRPRHRSEELGLTGTHVFFNDGWIPYARRADYLLEADIGISLHSDHVETAYSFRTRILDCIWAGLPIVATGGDSFAELIDREGLGTIVPRRGCRSGRRRGRRPARRPTAARRVPREVPPWWPRGSPGRRRSNHSSGSARNPIRAPDVTHRSRIAVRARRPSPELDEAVHPVGATGHRARVAVLGHRAWVIVPGGGPPRRRQASRYARYDGGSERSFTLASGCYCGRMRTRHLVTRTNTATLDDVEACYELLLNRPPDQEGVAHFRQRLESEHLSVLDVVAEIVGSPEYASARQTPFADPETVTVDAGRFRVHVFAADRAIGHAMAATGTFEQEVSDTLEWPAATGSVFVDVGANYGWHSLLAVVRRRERRAGCSPWSRTRFNTQLLRRSAEENGFSNITVRTVATSDRRRLRGTGDRWEQRPHHLTRRRHRGSRRVLLRRAPAATRRHRGACG